MIWLIKTFQNREALNSIRLLITSSIPNIRIVEVGPRDGLQNEKKILPTATKIDFINKLSATGLSSIEVTSFVSPKWVPQMSDSVEVFTGINKSEKISYPVLVPNMIGFEKAIEAGVREISIFAAASNTFSMKNLNCTVLDSLKRFKNIIEASKKRGIPVRGYLSTVIGCPYEGKIVPQTVANYAEVLMDMGCYEISLGDTIGVGTPGTVIKLLDEVTKIVPHRQLAVHFHDTYGQALANILKSLDYGINTVDSSISGLGGCPYAFGASGNVATEDLVYMLHGMGVETGISLEKLISVGQFICKQLEKKSESKVNIAYKG